jgi:B12-binding domain/radical SAM domain protein
MIKFPLKKRRIIFRIAPYNRLSFPVLLNAWESSGLDKHFEIITRYKPLTTAPFQTIEKGDAVLFSFMTPHLPLVHREIQQLKETGAWIAGGGPHITGEQELAAEAGFDILFAGPGETNFIKFGRDLPANKIKKHTIYKSPAGNADFNRYLPLSKYMTEIPPLEIMRGCFWNCTYCSTGAQDTTYRDMDSIKTFLDKITERKFQRINYICPSSMEFGATRGRALNLEKIRSLLELTKSYNFKYIEYGIFPSEIRPDTVTQEGMRMLKKYVSHKAITLGAQSGTDERLKKLKRAHTTEDIERAVSYANSVGFLANLDFITAYPDEMPDERRATIEFIKKMHKKYRIRTHLHHFFPLSGSPYAFRFPSFLLPGEKEALRALKRGGIARDGWVENEKQALHYFQWLKQNFPAYYSRYV